MAMSKVVSWIERSGSFKPLTLSILRRCIMDEWDQIDAEGSIWIMSTNSIDYGARMIGACESG